MTQILGAFVAGWKVEQGLLAHLRAWMPDYLPHVYREAQELLDNEDLPAFPLPQSYTVVEREPEKWPEDQLPAILAVGLGLDGKPMDDGAGNYRATFNVALGAINSSGEEDVTKLFADLYFTAATMICLDKPSLGGIAEDTKLVSAQNDQVDIGRNRTLAATFGTLQIRVANFLTITGGPSEHLEDPSVDPGAFPTPLTTDLELEKEEIPS